MMNLRCHFGFVVFFAACLIVGLEDIFGDEKIKLNSGPSLDEARDLDSHPVGGLLLRMDLIDSERRLVRVTWRNVGPKKFTISTAVRMTDDAKHGVEIPHFQVEFGSVRAFLSGTVMLDGEQHGLAMVLRRDADGKIPGTIRKIVDRIESVDLDPGDEYNVVFDLTNLFDFRPGRGAKEALVYFRYASSGPTKDGESYWNGKVVSNKLLIHRISPEDKE